MHASTTTRIGRAALLAVVLLCAPIEPRAQNTTERPQNPYQGREEIVEEGRGLLNQYCAHCHGPNAVQGERPRDLRRLRIRYANDDIVVFWNTVHSGRVEKGMPVWAGVLSDDALWRIFTFLQSIQTEQ